MPACPRCQNEEQEERDSEIICTGCGLVLDRFVVRNDFPDGTFIRREAPRSSGVDARFRAHQSGEAADEREVQRILAALKLPANHVFPRAMDLYIRATEVQQEPRVVKQVLRGVAACIACREANIPVYLEDIAVLVDSTAFDFARVLHRVLDELEAKHTRTETESFVRAAASSICCGSQAVGPIVKTTMKILEWMQQVEDLSVPSTPHVQAACSLQLACQSLKVQCTVEDAAAAFHLRGATIKKASLAIRQYMLLLARPLPWFSALTLQTVANRAEAIIHMDTVHRMVMASKQKSNGAASSEGALACQAAVGDQGDFQGQAEGSGRLHQNGTRACNPGKASAAGDTIAAGTAVWEKPHSPAAVGNGDPVGQQKRMAGCGVLQNPPHKKSRVRE